MQVHFICRGNTFRSRLAENYFNSLNIRGWKAISSGINASKNLRGPISPYTLEILKENNLYSFDKGHWTETVIELFDENDLVVFMNKDYYDFCVNILKYDFNTISYKIWDIKDVEDILTESECEDYKKVSFVAHEIYLNLKREIDILIPTLHTECK